MGNRLYVGNIAWSTTEEALRTHFTAGGRKVEKVAIVTSNNTGRSRGFGFVTMGSEEEATAALLEMNGTNLDGRPLKVSDANEGRQGDGGFVASFRAEEERPRRRMVR